MIFQAKTGNPEYYQFFLLQALPHIIRFQKYLALALLQADTAQLAKFFSQVGIFGL